METNLSVFNKKTGWLIVISIKRVVDCDFTFLPLVSV